MCSSNNNNLLLALLFLLQAPNLRNNTQAQRQAQTNLKPQEHKVPSKDTHRPFLTTTPTRKTSTTALLTILHMVFPNHSLSILPCSSLANQGQDRPRLQRSKDHYLARRNLTHMAKACMDSNLHMTSQAINNNNIILLSTNTSTAMLRVPPASPPMTTANSYTEVPRACKVLWASDKPLVPHRAHP